MTYSLPVGYLDVGDGLAVHVATLRRHTTDVRRVERWLPVVAKIQQQPPGSKAAFELLAGYTPDEVDEIILTLRELGALHAATVDALEHGVEDPEHPPLLFRVRRGNG